MAALVDPLLDAMQPFVDEPFALFGHSLGGLVAFELAHRCRARFGCEPEHLIIAAIAPPPHDAPAEGLTLHDDSAVARRLRFAGGTAPEILANDELMRLVAPRLDADFEVVDTYRPAGRQPLSCPITAIGGDADPVAPPESLHGWRDATTGPFRRRLLHGGHFFMTSQEPELLDALDALLAAEERHAWT